LRLPRDLFTFLGLAPRFALECAELERRQRELFVERQAEGPRALEQLNEAVRMLKDPAVRAEQLFGLRGWPIKGSPDPVLLERVFTDREFIDLARKKQDVNAIAAWLAAATPRHQALIDMLKLLIDGPAATIYPSEHDSGETSEAQRALLLLEELRYLTRAVAAAHVAMEAIEDAASQDMGS
jgi:hypothetical protein